jgi:hypothetical protein
MRPELPLALLLLLVATTLPIRSQIPAWSSVPASPGVALGLEQSYGYAVQGATVQAFSAITGAWTSLTALHGAPAITRSNEHFVVRDGGTFHAYSPRTGLFSAQATLASQAALLPQSTPQTWHSVLLDGNAVHVDFALAGAWQTLVFASPPQIHNGTFTILIQDGPDVLALSSFYGSTVTLPGATAIGAFG